MDTMPRSNHSRSMHQLKPLPLFRTNTSTNSSLLKISLLIASLALIITGTAAGFTINRVNNLHATQASTTEEVQAAAPTPTPQVAAATTKTFADLLSKKTDYSGWLAGLRQGSLWLVKPDSGQSRQITQAASTWHGPIADLYWSPDKQKIATLIMSPADAQAMATNPQAHLKSLGLQNITSPQAFPYGRLVIIDLSSKQLKQTSIELKNHSKPLVWLDNDRLAMMTHTLSIYQISSGQASSLIAAGNSDHKAQLSSPLAWDSKRQHLYFMKYKQQTNGQVGLVSRLELSSSKAEELFVLANESSAEMSAYQSIDLAVSSDNNRLALVSPQGLSYLDLEDMGMHQLSYSDDRLWMNQVVISNLAWSGQHRLTYQVMYQDGQKAWSGWDIKTQQTPVFAKGNLFAAWSTQSGQLAVGLSDQKKIALINPNWDNPVNSTMSSLALDWDMVSW